MDDYCRFVEQRISGCKLSNMSPVEAKAQLLVFQSYLSRVISLENVKFGQTTSEKQDPSAIISSLNDIIRSLSAIVSADLHESLVEEKKIVDSVLYRDNHASLRGSAVELDPSKSYVSTAGSSDNDRDVDVATSTALGSHLKSLQHSLLMEGSRSSQRNSEKKDFQQPSKGMDDLAYVVSAMKSKAQATLDHLSEDSKILDDISTLAESNLDSINKANTKLGERTKDNFLIRFFKSFFFFLMAAVVSGVIFVVTYAVVKFLPRPPTGKGFSLIRFIFSSVFRVFNLLLSSVWRILRSAFSSNDCPLKDL